MKARTIGPLLMMTAGAAVMFVPSASWVGAGEQEVCDTLIIQPARNDVEVLNVVPCDPCDTVPLQAGVIQPCVVDTVPETTGVPETTTGAPETTSGVGSGGGSLPETGSSNLGFIVLGGALVLAGGALLVTGRRTPELS